MTEQPRLARATVLQLLRYGAVSAVALGVDVGTLSLLKEAWGVDVLWANTAGFTLGAVVTFIASRTWVFSERRIRNVGAEFLVFVLIGIGGLALNDGIVWSGTAVGLHYLLAKGIAAGVGFLWNFFLRKYLVYR